MLNLSQMTQGNGCGNIGRCVFCIYGSLVWFKICGLRSNVTAEDKQRMMTKRDTSFLFVRYTKSYYCRREKRNEEEGSFAQYIYILFVLFLFSISDGLRCKDRHNKVYKRATFCLMLSYFCKVNQSTGDRPKYDADISTKKSTKSRGCSALRVLRRFSEAQTKNINKKIKKLWKICFVSKLIVASCCPMWQAVL